VVILGISGSLRGDSYNTKLLHNAAALLLPGVELVPFAGLKEVPPYDEDDDRDPAPAAAARLRDAIADADAVLFATPEYNSSVPGQLKNAIDWASRPLATNVLRNKPVAVVGASTGTFGAVWAQAELRKVLASTGARVLEGDLPVGHARTRFDEHGRLTDGELRARLAELVYGLVDEAVPIPAAAPVASAGAVPARAA
jgi:chromate reductase, NAD(P)H dehydrogenase (quinone)